LNIEAANADNGATQLKLHEHEATRLGRRRRNNVPFSSLLYPRQIQTAGFPWPKKASTPFYLPLQFCPHGTKRRFSTPAPAPVEPRG